MPSITSWSRLEPRARTATMRGSLQARVADPLWFLTRQWQLGEFQGEDGGSPVVTRLRTQTGQMAWYHPNPQGSGYEYDQSVPLETLVEREEVSGNARLAAEAGRHFLRLLDEAGLGHYKAAFVEEYGFKRPEEGNLDPESRRFQSVVAGRIPDGRALYRASVDAGGGLPPSPPMGNDGPRGDEVLRAWLLWYETRFSQPGTVPSAWVPERMEYTFAATAVMGPDDLALVAKEYAQGHLDWYSFDAKTAGETKNPDGAPVVTETVLPTHVTFQGAPAPRWWSFEDARVDFGAVETAADDLARMLTLEFALIYGNDWFVVPLELPVGAVCRIASLVVTDTFGDKTLVKPSAQSVQAGESSPWRFFQLSPLDGKEYSDLFLLPPVLLQSLEAKPVEEVLLLRDEMANMAWAVERVVESPAGRPLNRWEEWVRSRTPQQPRESDAEIAYRLQTEVPAHWIPLLPVKMGANRRAIRLKRGAMVKDGTLLLPEGQILEPDRDLFLYEEEVPRAGARVQRAYQYARWIDGSTHLWIGRSKQPGRGEGSSGLRFDLVEEKGPTS